MNTCGRSAVKWGAVAVAVAATVGLSATPSATPAAHAAPSTLTWGACDPVHRAGPEVQCATVRVPRDHQRPGPTIEVTVSKIPARDPSRKRGVLFGNPGGPGGDGISMFRFVRPPEQVRDEWDLIAVQPRGLLSATPVRCDPIRPSDDVLTSLGAVNRERCERNTPGYTKTLTTENTARDIDVVRRALGVDRISMYGISYGTLLMSTYATLFPQHTDRLVLDSGVDPAWIWNDVLAEQTDPYKKRVHAMMTWIADRDSRYHLGATPLAVYRKWSAKVTSQAGVPPSLAAPPAQVGDVPPGLTAVARAYVDGVNLTADARARFENFVATLVTPGGLQAKSSLLAFTRAAAPDRNLWPQVALQVAGRAPSTPLGKGQEKALQNFVDMQQLVLCNENQVPARPTDLPAAFISNFFTGDIFEAPGLVYRSGMACSGAAPVTRPLPISAKRLSVQPLQIQSLGDPQTPYRGSLAMHRLMNSHLITVGGGDHGQLGRSNKPLDSAITEYLRTGRTGVTAVPQAPITGPLNRPLSAGTVAGR